MISSIKSHILLSLVVLIWSCETKIPTNLVVNNVIPAPVNVMATGGTFQLNESMDIYVQAGSIELIKNAQFLADILKPPTGFDLPIKETIEVPSSGIYLNLNASNDSLSTEGYELEIGEDLVSISAANGAGVLMGIQTLRQLFPHLIESKTIQSTSWELPTGKIIDYPEYSHRGAMLDVARHFFGMDDVKRYIDLISGLKMNVLHLHLTDDQGWRIEIKSWPNLTTHGGKTSVGGGKGGFFSQVQYKEIVQYAADRYITVIPEIDFPSHTFAALTSYPELNCNGKVQSTIVSNGVSVGPDPYTGTEVGFCKVCTDKEVVYQFLTDVINELSAITPGPYIHIGGDESDVTTHEEYVTFIERAQEIILANDKKMIGWEEIVRAKLDSGTVMQYWARNREEPLVVSDDTKVIMSPARVAYLDMKYDTTTQLGTKWAAYIEVDSAYRWEPTKIFKNITKASVLGIEAPLWTETVETMNDIEYLVFPRIMGHAEIGWTPAINRSWEEYKVRLGMQASRLKTMGINYYPSLTVPWKE